MRAAALLLLLFGPVLSAPAAAGLWTRAWLEGEPSALAYSAVASVIALVLVCAALLSARLRQIVFVVLSAFWAGWLWLEMTAPVGDWLRPPALHAPDGAERAAIMLIVLVYLMLYVVAVQTRPMRRSAIS